jgi:ArsR family metal-binding transcriptional regulator
VIVDVDEAERKKQSSKQRKREAKQKNNVKPAPQERHKKGQTRPVDEDPDGNKYLEVSELYL